MPNDTERLDWLAAVCEAEENVLSEEAEKLTDDVAENLRDFYLRATTGGATPPEALRLAVDKCMAGEKPE